jgi:hypothetical protein
MMRASNIRLPGVYFLPPPPARGLGLPPLDVAAFVGFAERGPLNWPVVVEDLDTYRAIFGGKMPLAQERGGRTVYANLPSAVAMFFANGGRRCYVVRVAGRKATQTLFRVNGIVALKGKQDPTAAPDDGPRLATVKASSEGRWSERLRLGARLRITPLPVAAFEVLASQVLQTGDGPRLFHGLEWTTGSAPQEIQEGDLLRLTYEGGTHFLFPVAQVRRQANATPATPVRLLTQHVWQLELPDPARPLRNIVSVDRLTATTTDRIVVDGDLSVEDEKFFLKMSGNEAWRVQRNDVLQVKQIDNRSFLFPVSELGTATDGTGATQPLAIANHMLRLPAQDTPQVSPVRLVSVERLRFDLLLREGKDRRPTINELSFNHNHPRFWGDVVLLDSSPSRRRTDSSAAQVQDTSVRSTARRMDVVSPAAQSAALFRAMRGDARVDETRLATLNRSALAALLAPTEEADRTYLPLDMPAIATEEQIVGPAADDTGTDDLETFQPELFVDPVLVPDLAVQTTSGDALMREAFDRFHIKDKRLLGLHSLMFTDPAALLCVPEAVHREWERVTKPPPPPLTVQPLPPPPDLSKFSDCLPPVLSPPAVTSPPTDAGVGPSPDTVAEPPLLKPIDTNDETDPQYLRELQNLVQIQHAVLNFCEARRDVVGVFTLPHYFEKRQCLKWQEDLRKQLGLPRRGSALSEARDIADLSYVAIYHPWLLLADAASTDGLLAAPADGAVCGTIARREHEAQVWTAPANMALNGVLGLTPAVSTEDWAELFDLQFNLIRAGPRDFRAMSAHTLSDESIWLQISVRRLLILLRKLVVERGMDFVFESNHERFREGVRLMLEEVLRFMHAHGAFAGASPSQSYQVVTDRTVNPPQSVDAGRFIAQIQVAPAQPLEFITVLLTRVAEDLLQAREA